MHLSSFVRNIDRHIIYPSQRPFPPSAQHNLTPLTVYGRKELESQETIHSQEGPHDQIPSSLLVSYHIQKMRSQHLKVLGDGESIKVTASATGQGTHVLWGYPESTSAPVDDEIKRNDEDAEADQLEGDADDDDGPAGPATGSNPTTIATQPTRLAAAGSWSTDASGDSNMGDEERERTPTPQGRGPQQRRRSTSSSNVRSTSFASPAPLPSTPPQGSRDAGSALNTPRRGKALTRHNERIGGGYDWWQDKSGAQQQAIVIPDDPEGTSDSDSMDTVRRSNQPAARGERSYAWPQRAPYAKSGGMRRFQVGNTWISEGEMPDYFGNSSSQPQGVASKELEDVHMKAVQLAVEAPDLEDGSDSVCESSGTRSRSVSTVPTETSEH
ncbi:hypothetical protein B0H21DRAFT_753952 [Amylocystis lapponica]|nr:hypothetical protein B0H21DRAFT_753952 [Amylocystis lapponica]